MSWTRDQVAAARPAVPAARRGPDRLRPRLRARPVDRLGHRDGARRHPRPAGPARGRPAGRHRAAAGAGRAPGRGRRAGMRVLVVEDSRSLAEVLVEGLRDQGMAVDAAGDGLEAAAKLDVNSYDVVVLDRDLPGIHGDTLCQMITEQRRPGDGADADRGRLPRRPGQRPGPGRRRLPRQAVPLPRAGAAHPRPGPAPARRPGPGPCARPGSSWTRCGARSPGTGGCSTCRSRSSPSSRRCCAPARLPRAEDLLEPVWDEQADPFTNTVTVTIGRLRRKLGDPAVIMTTPGVGYRIADG